jgi:hypothetical protein
MAVRMSEVYAKMFPIKPENIKTPPPEERAKILENLTKSLALAQEEFERKDTGIIYRSLKYCGTS